MDILDIGQKVFFNGPLEDLKTNYLVTDKQIEMTTTADQQVIFYTYKLSSSFNDESSLNFFDNQRRKLRRQYRRRRVYTKIYRLTKFN